jgi:signal transduction histidine kinase
MLRISAFGADRAATNVANVSHELRTADYFQRSLADALNDGLVKR